MKTPRVYVADLLADAVLITLNRDAFKYIVRVLRCTEGDALVLFNGDGFNYLAVLEFTGPTTANARILQKEINHTESPLRINLVQALAKGTKLDLVIQKATELGVNQITPVTSQRSVLQLEINRVERKLTHWRGVAISAATQCQRSIVPQVEAPVSLTSWLDALSQPASCVLLHPTAVKPLKQLKLESAHCSVLVGPEGGFSSEEVAYAKKRGVTTFKCGPRILRTETAGFTAVAILQSLYGDL